jgi:hypothetical protein
MAVDEGPADVQGAEVKPGVKPDVKPEVKSADWPARIVSVVGLLVSLVTAYFSLLFTADDLRVVVTDGPSVESTSGGVIAMHVPYTLSFINSGSRTLVIRRAKFSLRPEKEELPCERRFDWIQLNLDSMIIKPTEIVDRTSVKPLLNANNQIPGHFSMRKEDPPELAIPCIQFEITTPERGQRIETIRLDPIFVHHVEGRIVPFADVAKIPRAQKPHILIKQRFWLGASMSEWWERATHRDSP